MKKIIALGMVAFGALFATSCLNDDGGGTNFSYVYLPAEKVETDTILPLGQVSKFDVYYTVKNVNEKFYQFNEMSRRGDTIEIAIVGQKFDNPTTDTTSSLITKKEVLTFRPDRSGKFVFKVWGGKDEANNDEFVIHDLEIPER